MDSRKQKEQENCINSYYFKICHSEDNHKLKRTCLLAFLILSSFSETYFLGKESERCIQGHPEKQAAPPLLSQIICQIFVINTLREGVRKKSEGFIPLEMNRQCNWFLTKVLMDKRQKLVCKFRLCGTRIKNRKEFYLGVDSEG